MTEVPSSAGTFLIQDEEEISNSTHRGILSEHTYHEIAPEDGDFTDKYFGANVLNRYQDLQSAKDLEIPTSIIELYQEALKISVNRSKELLASYCKGDSEEKVRAGTFINTVFRNDELRVAYENYYNSTAKRRYKALGRKWEDIRLNSVEEVISTGSFTFPGLPDDIYLKMLLEYKKGFELKTLETRKRLDEFYDNELPELIRGFANMQGLNEEELLKRLSDNKKRLKLGFQDSKTLELWFFGLTNAEGGISIDPFLNFENVLKPVLTHEVLHNIAGHLYRVWKVKGQDLPFYSADFEQEDEEDKEFSEYVFNYAVPEKSGFHFLNSFGWLNEGCTDLATLRIFKSEYMAIGYNNEIELIDKILKEGKIKIPEQLLFKAYFESYDENLPLNQQLPYVKQFFSETSKSFAPGFVGKLSSFIDSYSYNHKERADVIERINGNFPKIVEIFSSREPRNVRENKAIALLYPEEGEKLLDDIGNGGTYTSGT